MAYENFPSAETATTSIVAKPKNDQWKTITIGLLSAALVGTWGYLIYDKNNNSKTIQQKDTLIASTTSQRDGLQKELEDAEMKFDQLKSSSAGELAKKDSTTTARDRDINAKKDRIRQLLSKVDATKEELAEAKTLINSLNSDIVGYKEQVEKLTGENIRLTGENTTLTAEKETVTKERDEVKKNYDDAKTQIKQKEETIEVGSTLHASEFRILAINEKNGGKEKRTDNINKADLLRVDFVLDANRITQTGNKEIYVCITAPDGTPVAVQANGSGKFTTREDGEKIYTKKVDVNYETGKPSYVTVDWKQDAKFQTGDYKIEAYQNGFKIGEGLKSLKKGGLF